MPVSARRAADWFELSGGALCLDFANTVSKRPATPMERVETVADLLEWMQKAGILSAAEMRRRLEESRTGDAQAAADLERARRGREILYLLFSDVAAQRDVRRMLDLFTAEWRRVLPSTTMTRRGQAIRWEYDGPRDSIDALLWPVLWSAAELLASPDLSLVRECAARDCGWLFVDRSRGHRRRWCDMQVCGNREKLRRFRDVRS